MNFKKLEDMEIAGRHVLIRQDLNVPFSHGRITSTKRIDAALPMIRTAIDAGARTMLMSHLGRPEEGKPDEQYSLAPVARYLSDYLGKDIPLVANYLESPPVPAPGEVVMLENVRFNRGEYGNDDELSRRYARMCDLFVMDAFGAAHRAQASTYGVAAYAPQACAGPLLSAELEALDRALSNPARPLVAIVGGAKVSSKLTVLESLIPVVDMLIPGGGIANTFLAAAGYPVGQSLYEPGLVGQAQRLFELARNRGWDIHVPRDVVVGKTLSSDTPAVVKSIEDVGDTDKVLDVGPRTADYYAELMQQAGTILWNGPVGVFELDQFAAGTRKLGEAIVASSGFSVAGGGDTLAAIDRFGLEPGISTICTGGGAFLEYIENRTLPAVAILEQRAG